VVVVVGGVVLVVVVSGVVLVVVVDAVVLVVVLPAQVTVTWFAEFGATESVPPAQLTEVLWPGCRLSLVDAVEDEEEEAAWATP
jgi:hypothetical protein